MTKKKGKQFVVSISDLTAAVEGALHKYKGELMSTGCGSTEYVFKSKRHAERARDYLAKHLVSMFPFERGDDNE